MLRWEPLYNALHHTTDPTLSPRRRLHSNHTPTLTARAAVREHSLLLVVCVVHELMATRKGIKRIDVHWEVALEQSVVFMPETDMH